MKDFAAIDFETANECRCSVCSVGVVIVRNGEIVDSFYSLIPPEPEYYQWFCQQVHGLSEEDTEDAPVFPYVWEKIAPLIQDLPLVAHNSRFDEGCLKEVIKVYQMDYPDYEFYDTLAASRKHFGCSLPRRNRTGSFCEIKDYSRIYLSSICRTARCFPCRGRTG
ncbi:MAG: 3'-5' exoribonuclease [Bacteroidales bacterium]|nr:3'-5' exoribonuclease [Bacteroidales bacterium]